MKKARRFVGKKRKRQNIFLLGSTGRLPQTAFPRLSPLRLPGLQGKFPQILIRNGIQRAIAPLDQIRHIFGELFIALLGKHIGQRLVTDDLQNSAFQRQKTKIAPDPVSFLIRHVLPVPGIAAPQFLPKILFKQLRQIALRRTVLNLPGRRFLVLMGCF